MAQERLGPSYFFISFLLGPLNSLLWYVPFSRYTWSSFPIWFLQDQIKSLKDIIITFLKSLSGETSSSGLGAAACVTACCAPSPWNQRKIRNVTAASTPIWNSKPSIAHQLNVWRSSIDLCESSNAPAHSATPRPHPQNQRASAFSGTLKIYL